jgi:hypothetical protein
MYFLHPTKKKKNSLSEQLTNASGQAGVEGQERLA